MTPKTKLRNDKLKLIDDMLKSENTFDGKKMPSNIGKSYIDKQEMCEDPPEFISENGDFNPDILNRSLAADGPPLMTDGGDPMKLNLSEMKAEQDSFLSENTPFGLYDRKKKHGISMKKSKDKRMKKFENPA
jgi:hypothetical protein